MSNLEHALWDSGSKHLAVACDGRRRLPGSVPVELVYGAGRLLPPKVRPEPSHGDRGAQGVTMAGRRIRQRDDEDALLAVGFDCVPLPFVEFGDCRDAA